MRSTHQRKSNFFSFAATQRMSADAKKSPTLHETSIRIANAVKDKTLKKSTAFNKTTSRVSILPQRSVGIHYRQSNSDGKRVCCNSGNGCSVVTQSRSFLTRPSTQFIAQRKGTDGRIQNARSNQLSMIKCRRVDEPSITSSYTSTPLSGHGILTFRLSNKFDFMSRRCVESRFTHTNSILPDIKRTRDRVKNKEANRKNPRLMSNVVLPLSDCPSDYLDISQLFDGGGKKKAKLKNNVRKQSYNPWTATARILCGSRRLGWKDKINSIEAIDETSQDIEDDIDIEFDEASLSDS